MISVLVITELFKGLTYLREHFNKLLSVFLCLFISPFLPMERWSVLNVLCHTCVLFYILWYFGIPTQMNAMLTTIYSSMFFAAKIKQSKFCFSILTVLWWMAVRRLVMKASFRGLFRFQNLFFLTCSDGFLKNILRSILSY